jgi:DNA-binding Lrp family transcriptional regulator
MKKELPKRLLSELLKDSKRSDRELAKVLGVSQPTVTRRKQQLVKDGIIREFTAIPDFVKMGYEIMAVTFGKYRLPRTPALVKEEQEWLEKYPNIIFASTAQGMGKDEMMISLHKSFTEYSKFVTDLSARFGDDVENSGNVLISLKNFMAKPLSLRYLAQEESSEG